MEVLYPHMNCPPPATTVKTGRATRQAKLYHIAGTRRPHGRHCARSTPRAGAPSMRASCPMPAAFAIMVRHNANGDAVNANRSHGSDRGRRAERPGARRHTAPSPCPGTPGRNGAVLPADGKTPLRCTGTAGEARGAGPCRRGERALPHGGAGRRSGRAAIRNHLAGTRLSLASLLFALLLATTACTASAGAGGSEGRSAAGSPSAAAEAAAPSAEAAPSPESEAPDVAGPADERPQRHVLP